MKFAIKTTGKRYNSKVVYMDMGYIIRMSWLTWQKFT